MATRRSVPASQVLRQVVDQLDQGWPAGLTVLSGDDTYHVDRALGVLLDKLAGRERSSFDFSVFGEEPVDLATVIGSARSMGMFASRRVVLVRDISALEGDVAALTDYASTPPAESFLIVRAPALDLRRKLHKALAKSGKRIVFDAASPTDSRRLLADVRAMAKDRGVALEASAATLLAEVCAGDLHRVASELGKIAAWRGDSTKPVDLQAVRTIASGSGLLSGWEVADAILLRDRPAALSAARRLVQAGDVPIRIVGGLAYRARSMLQAKAMLAAGASFRQVVSAARAWPYQEKLEKGLARYSLEELLCFPSMLLEADRTLKSRSIEPGAVIEALVDRMTAEPRRDGMEVR